MDNTKLQDVAVDAIHRICREAKMCAFLLVDEDLAMCDGFETLTQEEKEEIFDNFHEAMLDHYYEIMEQAVRDVIDDRNP